MLKTITAIFKTIICDNIVALFFHICSAVETVFSYLNKKIDAKKQKNKNRQKAKANGKIESACDDGNLNDLLDAIKNKKSIKSAFIIFLIFTISGCYTVEIQAAKQWEGRYSDTKAASEAINGITLERGESIWILSNKTLKRILTNDTED